MEGQSGPPFQRVVLIDLPIKITPSPQARFEKESRDGSKTHFVR
jgi:hypothetical protein